MTTDKKTRLRSLPLRDIRIEDGFWSRYIRTIYTHGIAYQWETLNDRVPGVEKSYAIRNFRAAAGLEKNAFGGLCFQDNDLAKWLEAVAYSLETKPNPELEKLADETIELIGAAQQPDGYINTYFTLARPGERFRNMRDSHEVFCAGHFFEAAVAYYNATGKDAFLKIVSRYADLICDTFGDGEGQIPGYDGHAEVELALVRLAEATGNRRYLEQAKYFIDKRGTQPNYLDEEKARPGYKPIFDEVVDFDNEYFQNHKPVREQTTAEGHAVRLAYLFAGAIDVADAFGDEELMHTCEQLFDNIVGRRMYITGSIGSAERGERFTTDFDLPNHSNYSESCATVGLALLAKRMLETHRSAKYADVMERALYNTLLSGIALKGDAFFYVNPLEVIPDVAAHNTNLHHVKTVRQPWFGCACCPPNIIRTLASFGQYIYSATPGELYVNLYVSNKTETRVDGRKVQVVLDTTYPFGSQVGLTLQAEGTDPMTVALRIPQNTTLKSLTLDGRPCGDGTMQDGYLRITRDWSTPAVLELDLDMPVVPVYANPHVRSDVGKAAVMKGPVVYCLEEADNGKNLGALELAADADFTEEYDPDLLGGTLVLRAKGFRTKDDWGDDLYRTTLPIKQPATLTFVPYCYWNNRGEGEMLVWVRRGS